ncbi:hypothetical protein [Flavobacterium sp.]|uniref:hypothetical protein n=1 Tax=Flavobacterium sp. TaxID=239 RepID=UPI0026078798|nr:hypothetical protein [Flavobacterium sp.]
MDIENNRFQWFFTFIGKSAQTRLIGFTTATIIFLSLIAYSQWKQHLSDDKETIKNLKEEISRLTKSVQYKDEKYNELSVDFINYVKDVTKRNDSIAEDNQKFLNELRIKK